MLLFVNSENDTGRKQKRHLQVFDNFELAKNILLVPQIKEEVSSCQFAIKACACSMPNLFQVCINVKKEGKFDNLL